jgi:cytochrome c oxidase assembly protein subunit 15
MLLAVGGIVTSTGTGLAVVDWPNSFGYNMFLYPFSRMTGGIYYEHSHRLFGALVGLTTLVLALLLQRTEVRRGVRLLAWSALGLVIVQGILGGLRVTGRWTLSSTSTMYPSLTLAVVHGVVAQLFLALLVAIGVLLSESWRRARAGTDRLLSASFFAAMLCQLVLGALQRHLDLFLIFHVLVGLAVVSPLALHLGIRQLLSPRPPLFKRLGLALLLALFVQVALGFAAFVMVRGEAAGTASAGLAVAVATAHQWLGAVLLASGVVFLCFSLRR